MLLKKVLLTASASLVMVLGVIAIVIACQPSAQPPLCPQSIFLAKFAPEVELIPEDGSAFDVEIGMFPYVTWDAITGACATPSGASLTVMLECTETASGAMFDLGPETIPVATPTVPGVQPPGGLTIDFPIPAGIEPSTCDVVATYSVGFTGGGGAGTLSATGDTQICFVEPAPSNPAVPRLDLALIELNQLPGRDGRNGAFSFHAGDQEYVFVRITNNDLENAVEIDFESTGLQNALLPDGITDDEAAYNAGVFRISDPGDTFPADFFSDNVPLPFDRVGGTPGGIGDGLIETSVRLEPGAVDILGIVINSFGACADGSCNERNLCGIGTFFDADSNEVGTDPACVQFVYNVENGNPRYPGITYDVSRKVNPDVDSQSGPVQFLADDAFVDETHSGNLLPGQKLPPLQGGPAVQLTGDNLRDPVVPFPGTWNDQIVLPVRPDQVFFQTFTFAQQDNFQLRATRVTLTGLDQLNGSCEFPNLTLNNALNPATNVLDIEADVSDGCNDETPVILREGGQVVRQGTLGTLKEDQNIRIDIQTCTIINPVIDVLNRPFMVADPPFIAHNFDPLAEDPFQNNVFITDPDGRELEYTARFEGTGGVAIVGSQGRGLSQVFLNPDPLRTPYDEIAGYLVYENNQAVNSPLAVPVLARRLPPLPGLLPMIGFELHGPSIIQVGDEYPLHINIPVPPEPGAVIENLEALVQLDNPDPVRIFLPPSSPYTFIPIDGTTPQEEVDRLQALFGDGFESGDCSSGMLKCGVINFGTVDTFPFEEMIFTDGFESGNVSVWSSSTRGSNTQAALGKAGGVAAFLIEQPFIVLDPNGGVPVETPDELRTVIELLDADDTGASDGATIGLNNDYFPITQPLPPIRGTYFFDEFESFRKRAQVRVTIDGSQCPAPCSGLVFEGPSGGISNIRLQNFPNYGAEIRNDSLWIASNEFAGNGMGGLLINGNNNFVADSLVRANRFEENGGAGITVENGVGNRLLFNTFTDAAGVYIDLGGDGITANDDGDRDAGPNNLQNFPVLDNVLTGGSTTLTGSLNSTPNSSFTLQFFARNDSLLRYLGDATIDTDGNGDARFDVVVEGTAEIGQEVYATATGPDGSTSEFSAAFEVISGVATEGPQEVPSQFALDQNYPNPFNPSTTIRYAVPHAGPVRLEVFDVLGRLVAVLVDERKAAGSYTVAFEAGGLPSGTYLYTMTGDGFKQTRSFVLAK